jgi:hypothetical protein
MSQQSKDSSGYVDLNYVISDIIVRLRLEPKLKKWVLQTVIDCVRDLVIFHLKGNGVKAVKVSVDPDLNFIDLPSDYIDYVSVGTIINGEVKRFKLNTDIAIPLGIINGLNIKENINIAQEQHYHHHENIEFDIDRKGRRIIFKGCVPNNICYLEYETTGISLNEKTYIPVTYLSTLRAYVDWQNEALKPDNKIKFNTTREKGIIYGQHVIEVIEHENKWTIQECLDVIRGSYRFLQPKS